MRVGTSDGLGYASLFTPVREMAKSPFDSKIEVRLALTCIIPAYNEEQSLRAFLPEVLAFCRRSGHRLIANSGGRLNHP